LLTATPHSGDDEAFHRLLGLLDPAFAVLAQSIGPARDRLRARLAQHFVQRRRPDIAEWQDGTTFARRQSKELTYLLTGAWELLFSAVLDYCASVVAAAAGDTRRQRLNFWGTLALMRCVSSSPAAAVQALRTRVTSEVRQADGADDDVRLRVFDGAADTLPDDDVEPTTPGDDADLSRLIRMAEGLTGKSGDPKLQLLLTHLDELLAEGFHPVVFCRYIATAHYLGRHLREKLKNALPLIVLDVVTGELTSAEREQRIDELGKADSRLLVATDCLSEGINLQQHFDAVVHYDLSWNPTRHEQREGRVDRLASAVRWCARRCSTAPITRSTAPCST
jgi:SNF2 family DNA or RNA helicase